MEYNVASVWELRWLILLLLHGHNYYCSKYVCAVCCVAMVRKLW